MTTILIIDDDPTNLSLLLNHLRQAQFRVLVAESGEVGLERANLVKPDLIMLDVMMSGLDGFETCRLLKLNPHTQDIPVIFMTALNDTVDIVRGFGVGGVDYITKPLHEQETLARITTHLTLQRLKNEMESTVQERTASLQKEIERRQQLEMEKEELFQLVRSQTEQLYQANVKLVQHQVDERQNINQSLEKQITVKLAVLNSTLSQLLLRLDGLSGDKLMLNQVHTGLDLVTQIQQTLQSLSEELQATMPAWSLDDPRLRLPPRELEVLHFIVKGCSNSEIAEKLVLSVGTVSTYRHRLMRKFEATSTADLIKIARKYNLYLTESGYTVSG